MTKLVERRSWSIALIAVVGLVSSLAAVHPDRAGAMPVAAKAAKADCALTGKTVAAKIARRPSVAIRISNSPDARPQTGVATADLVIETPVEGGLTRLIAVFHCSPATAAGPVRSARIDDADIVAPLSKLFGFSGANARVMGELQSSGLVNVTELTSGEAISRIPSGSTDVNSVRANLTVLRAAARVAGHGKPSAGFRFGKVQSRRPSISSIDLNFGSTSVQYRWKSGSWVRSQDGAAFRDASGSLVKTNNVLVQEVDTNASTGLFDSAGVASPRFDLVGTGRALLFRNGRVVIGSWTDRGAGAPVFKTQKGAVMNLSPGTTWLEMVPGPDGNLSGSIAYR